MLLLLVATGCAAPAPSNTIQGRAGSGDQPASAERATRGPTTLNMTVLAEPNVLVTNLDTVGATLFGNGAVHFHLNSYLTLQDPNDVTVPSMAAELPSLDNGTIRLYDDGRMETTWKLRPGITWHDGTPFTASDLVFSWKVASHPSWPVRNAVARVIIAMETPDTNTVVMTWREPSRFAANMTRATLDPLPAHKLEAAWVQNPEALPTHPHFSDASAFVGTGAFRVTQWDRGSQMMVEAYPEFFLGKPKIDRILFRFVRDRNTAIANLLAGASDVANNQLGYDEVQTVENQWRATNGGTTTITTRFFRFLFVQARPEEATPRDLAVDARVRRAILHAIDREQLSDGVSPGSGNRFVAHAPTPPDLPEGAAVDRVIPKYSYDPNRAQQLLQEAGWARGADGIAMKGAERFTTEMRNGALPEAEKVFQIIQFDLKRVGIDLASLDSQSTPNPVDYALYPGFVFSTNTGLDKFDGRNIATAQNRWSGQNGSGYSNPMVDRMNDQYLQSVRIDDQYRYLGEGFRLLLEDAALVPLYYFPNAAAMRRGVNIPVPQTTQVYWQSHLWEIEPAGG
jgi:peptide/nickel transport system substrate-binding protein